MEHLYALVLQTIEHLTQQRAGTARATSGADGADCNGDGNSGGETDGAFLLLDDLLEVGTDIDLPPLDGDGVKGRGGGAEITRPKMFLLEEASRDK